MEADVVLILLLAGGFLLGFFRGVIRQVVALGGLIFSFLLAAYLRAPVGDWVFGTGVAYSANYANMLAFAGLFFTFGLTIAVVAMISRGATRLVQHPVLDDVLGGMLGVIMVVLLIALTTVVLDSHYAVEVPPPGADAAPLAALRDLLGQSTIATGVRQTVLVGLAFVLGPLLPPDLRAVMP